MSNLTLFCFLFFWWCETGDFFFFSTQLKLMVARRSDLLTYLRIFFFKKSQIIMDNCRFTNQSLSTWGEKELIVLTIDAALSERQALFVDRSLRLEYKTISTRISRNIYFLVTLSRTYHNTGGGSRGKVHDPLQQTVLVSHALLPPHVAGRALRAYNVMKDPAGPI